MRSPKLWAAIVVAPIAGALALATITPAAATGDRDHDRPGKHCPTWNARGATGTYPDITFGKRPLGTIITPSSARLTKPMVGTAPGVEFAARDMKVFAFGRPATVTVNYRLQAGASASAGAVRMFGYAAQDADTIHSGPTYGPAIASGTSGVLSLTVPAGKKLGTLGLVYDASNDARGAVVFSELKINGRLVSFGWCPKPEPSGSASPSPSSSPSGEPSAEPSTEPSEEPSGQPSEEPSTEPSGVPSNVPTTYGPPPAPGAGAGGGPSLPLTGAPAGLLAAGGVLLAVLGAGAVLVMRRRRTQFEA